MFAQQTLTSPHRTEMMGLPRNGCLFDQIKEARRKANPDFVQGENSLNERVRSHNRGGGGAVLVIPVVVHVIHNNGPELITNEQILAGIDHLNQAFSNSGEYQNADGVDTHIQFCLAQQDPDGLYTQGWTYTQSALTNMNAETQDLELKNLIRWDPNRYLNIWLVGEITSTSMGAGIAGYAFFPTSQGQPEDGIVNEAAFFGSTVDNSKVHIHEAGHYLGLYHTFNGGCVNNDCQTDGDQVCDTPPDNSTAAVLCNSSVNTCTTDSDDSSTNNPFRAVGLGGLGDQTDMFQNYMDYGYQACQAYFTQGQSDRMYAMLETQRAILLESNGCASPCPPLPTVQILSAGSEFLVTATVTFEVGDLIADSYEWFINGVLMSNQTTFTYQFNTAGEYEIKLLSHFTSTSCPQTTILMVTIICPVQSSFVLNSDYQFNSPVIATNTSINATAYSWYLDGDLVSNTVDWQEAFATPGAHRIFLVAANGVCADSSITNFFEIGNCNMSGLSSNWMSEGQHIHFDENGPILLYMGLASGQNGQESSASMSDADGNLLFYTDGMTVWNNQFLEMPNGSGLIGNYSSTQGALILPHPGNPNQYYILTNDATENYMANGLHYSIVDMTLENGLGDVLPESKNTLITLLGSERLSATWHSNGHSIWIVTGNKSTSEQYSFLLDEAGIHLTPVISEIGPPGDGNALGRIKFSHDGNRAAMFLVSWPWRIALCDFDKSTGTFHDPLEILMSVETNEQVYGLEFSPDNSKLYAGMWQSNNILQYDLSYTTVSEIQNSRTAVDPYEYDIFSELILGPDDKIYVKSGGNNIDVIEYPNLPGLACQYMTNVSALIYLNQNNLTMPNFMNGLATPHQPTIAGPVNVCTGGTEHLYGVLMEFEGDSLVWEHQGDGVLEAVSGTNQVKLTSANSIGTDMIAVTIYGNCGITRDTIYVSTNLPETTNLPDVLYWCNDSLLLDPGEGFITYSWQDNSTTQVYLAGEIGTYSVNVLGASGCLIHDEVELMPNPQLPALDLGDDITICQGSVANLMSSEVYPHYHWQDGSPNSSFTAWLPGTYTLTVTDDCAFTDTDEILVTLEIPMLNITFNGSDSICDDQLPALVTAPSGFATYNWSNGQLTQSITVSNVGSYGLTAITSAGCYATDIITVNECVGLPEESNGALYLIYPNPTQNEFLLQMNGGKAAHWKLYSNTGQVVRSSGSSLMAVQRIKVQDLADGIYYFIIEIEGVLFAERLVKIANN
jgi:Pregnancy-associated plasma protein-A/Secretion system C-terminal sorting domain